MDEKKLEEMYQMVRENNGMLKGARRSAFVSGVVKVVFWVLILVVLPYVTWIYMQPYLDLVVRQYDSIQQKSGAVTQQAADVQKQLAELQTQTNGFMDLLKQFGIGGN